MVIETGTADVSHDGEHLADLGPGDFFGEMALLLNVPRTATVAATSEVTLVVMHERNFRAMEEEIPAIAERVNAIMEERRAKSADQGIDTPEAKG
jgi:CRP-like cAMP-binding protein